VTTSYSQVYSVTEKSPWPYFLSAWIRVCTPCAVVHRAWHAACTHESTWFDRGTVTSQPPCVL